MDFFKKFPLVDFDIKKDGTVQKMVDVFRSVRPVEEFLDDPAAYRLYEIRNGERPDIVSTRLYGSPEFYWTFFVINEFLHDGYRAWPLSEEDLFFSDNEIHIRQPKVSHIIPSHQDNFYFCLKNGIALTCYIYLTKQSRISGGLGFLRSSINTITLPHDKSSIEGFSSFNKNKESLSEEYIYPDTNSGDVIFHYSQTFHRADPNQTENATASISLRVFSYSNLKKDESMRTQYLKNLNFNRSF